MPNPLLSWLVGRVSVDSSCSPANKCTFVIWEPKVEEEFTPSINQSTVPVPLITQVKLAEDPMHTVTFTGFIRIWVDPAIWSGKEIEVETIYTCKMQSVVNCLHPRYKFFYSDDWTHHMVSITVGQVETIELCNNINELCIQYVPYSSCPSSSYFFGCYYAACMQYKNARRQQTPIENGITHNESQTWFQ